MANDNVRNVDIGKLGRRIMSVRTRPRDRRVVGGAGVFVVILAVVIVGVSGSVVGVAFVVVVASSVSHDGNRNWIVSVSVTDCTKGGVRTG